MKLRIVVMVMSAVAALPAAGCSSDQPPVPAPTATVTVSSPAPEPAGKRITAKAGEIDSLVNQGCGEGKAITCAESAARLKPMVAEVRSIMNSAGTPEFYSPAYALADRVARVSDPIEVRGAVIQFTKWITQHPGA